VKRLTKGWGEKKGGGGGAREKAGNSGIVIDVMKDDLRRGKERWVGWIGRGDFTTVCHTYQSVICMTLSNLVPRTAGGRNPPLTNAFPRIPPSKLEYFPPLCGKLLAPDSPEKHWMPCVEFIVQGFTACV